VLIAVNGFASIWSSRFGKAHDDPYRFSRSAAYYNTTGVIVRGKIRHRSRIFGQARFDASGGFNPHQLPRMIHQVFECREPCTWQERNKVLFRRKLGVPQRPDCFLVVVTAEQTGWLEMREGVWKSDDTSVISVSQCRDQQEAMLLMPAYGWLRGRLGTFFLEPSMPRPWEAALRLDG